VYYCEDLTSKDREHFMNFYHFWSSPDQTGNLLFFPGTFLVSWESDRTGDIEAFLVLDRATLLLETLAYRTTLVARTLLQQTQRELGNDKTIKTVCPTWNTKKSEQLTSIGFRRPSWLFNHHVMTFRGPEEEEVKGPFTCWFIKA